MSRFLIYFEEERMMTYSERRRARKLARMREREIEELNNPRPMMFISDIIVQVLIGTVCCVGTLFLGWLGCYCWYHIMAAFGMY